MLNQYPLWKNLLVGFVLLVGLMRYIEVILNQLREVTGVADRRDA